MGSNDWAWQAGHFNCRLLSDPKRGGGWGVFDCADSNGGILFSQTSTGGFMEDFIRLDDRSGQQEKSKIIRAVTDQRIRILTWFRTLPVSSSWSCCSQQLMLRRVPTNGPSAFVWGVRHLSEDRSGVTARPFIPSSVKWNAQTEQLKHPGLFFKWNPRALIKQLIFLQEKKCTRLIHNSQTTRHKKPTITQGFKTGKQSSLEATACTTDTSSHPPVSLYTKHNELL